MGQGTLAVPPSGTIYLDTQIIIYAVERHPTYGPALEPLWEAAVAGEPRVVTSELTLMEVLGTPMRARDTLL